MAKRNAVAFSSSTIQSEIAVALICGIIKDTATALISVPCANKAAYKVNSSFQDVGSRPSNAELNLVWLSTEVV